MSEPLELRYKMTPKLQLTAAYGWAVRGTQDGITALKLFNVVIWVLLFLAFLMSFQGGQWGTRGAMLLLALGGYLFLNGIGCVVANGRLQRMFAASVSGTSDVTFRLDQDEISITDDVMVARYAPRAIDDVVALKGATGLRVGAGTVPVPDEALPEGLSPEAFRERLLEWSRA